MTNFLIKRFIKDYEDVKNPLVREQYGNMGSIVGIVSNAFLSLIKILVGFLFNSISITADGVNNLSDTSSSFITLVGFKIGGKPADREHPFGHARYEYISGLAVGFIILMLGVELVKTSFGKIIRPEPVEFSALMVAVLLVSIAIKLWQSRFNNIIANEISSSTLRATSLDSRNDAITTFAILISIVITKLTGLQIDGYMGLAVALFIIYSGINILRDILNPLLGDLPDSELINSIEKKLREYKGVINIHDLIVHNYGPGRYFATVHAEVDAREDILKSHDLIDNIERDFADDMGINMVIHLDPVITDDYEINHLKCLTDNIVKAIDENLSIHDFRVVKGTTHTNLIFDVEVPVDFCVQSKDLLNKIECEIKKENSTYFSVITVDRSYISTHLNKPILK